MSDDLLRDEFRLDQLLRDDLWTCPRCARQFANENQSHSCGVFTVDEFLAGRPEHELALYHRFAELALSVGRVTPAPARTRVGFQARMIFASVNKLGPKGLDAHVVLARRLVQPRFYRIDSFSPLNHAHCFRVSTLTDLNEEVRDWLREAYEVGEQRHLPHNQRDPLAG